MLENAAGSRIFAFDDIATVSGITSTALAGAAGLAEYPFSIDSITERIPVALRISHRSVPNLIIKGEMHGISLLTS